MQNLKCSPKNVERKKFITKKYIYIEKIENFKLLYVIIGVYNGGVGHIIFHFGPLEVCFSDTQIFVFWPHLPPPLPFIHLLIS